MSLDRILKNKISFIFNPYSTKYSEKKVNYLMKRLNPPIFEYHVVKKKGDAGSFISKKIAEQGASLFILGGGDGFIFEAINVNADPENTFLGFLPMGNSNDFAKVLGLTKEDIACYLFQELLSGKISLDDCVQKMDLTKVTYHTKDGKKNDVHTTSTFTLGWTASLCNEVETNLKRGVFESIIRRAFGKNSKYISKASKVEKEYVPLEAEIECCFKDKKVQSMSYSNLRFIAYLVIEQAAGMPHVNPHCHSDGLGNLFLIEKRGFWKSLSPLINLKILENDKHITAKKKENGFNKYGMNYLEKIKSIEINILNPDDNLNWHLEFCGEAHEFDPKKPVKAEVISKAINVFYMPELLEKKNKHLRMHYEMNPGFSIFNTDSI